MSRTIFGDLKISRIFTLYKSNIESYSELNLKEQTEEETNSQPNITENRSLTEYKATCKRLFKAGEFDKAAIAISNSIELNKSDPEAYFIRAVIYQKLKKNSFAIQDLDRCIELDPNNGKYYHDRAVLLISEKKYQLVFDDIKTAEKLGYIGEMTEKIMKLEKDFINLRIRARSGDKKVQSLLTENGVSW